MKCQPVNECISAPISIRYAFECCKMPKLFDSGLVVKCSDYLKPTKQKSVVGCCMSECILNATGISMNNKINMDVAEKVMNQSIANDKTWIKVLHCIRFNLDLIIINSKCYKLFFFFLDFEQFNHEM